MAFIGLLFFVVGWIWSVMRGLQVSALCIVLNFIFPPLSQLIFAVYEPAIRSPLAVMAIGLVVLYFNGSWR